MTSEPFTPHSAIDIESAGAWLNVHFKFSRTINEELKRLGGFFASRAKVWKVPAEQRRALGELAERYREIMHQGGEERFKTLPSRRALRTDDGAIWMIVEHDEGHTEVWGYYERWLVRKATINEEHEEIETWRDWLAEGKRRAARQAAKRELLDAPTKGRAPFPGPTPEWWPAGDYEHIKLDPQSHYGHTYSVNDTAFLFPGGEVVIFHYNADWDGGSDYRLVDLPNAADLARRAAPTEGEITADRHRQIAHLASSRTPEIDQIAG
ncbi:hypothetical protein [Microbacterium sp. NPDC055683]